MIDLITSVSTRAGRIGAIDSVKLQDRKRPTPHERTHTLKVHGRILSVLASYSRNDGSSVRRSAEECAGKFLDLYGVGDVETAMAIAQEGPEIFVDLMAHTTGARWSAGFASSREALRASRLIDNE